MTPPEPSPPSFLNLRMLARMAASLVIVLGGIALLLFLPAGRLDWIEAWAFIVAFGGFLVLYGAWVIFMDPAQLQERSRRAANIKDWDRVIMGIYNALLPLLLLVCGLDAVRFRWAPVTLGLELAAWAGETAGALLVLWAAASNTYLSRDARIQEERGHTVVTRGPYRFVRHPMYAGLVIIFTCLPLMLDSGWGLLPGGCIALLFVLRTYKEDLMLQQELAGYTDYAQRVRYRLLPGVW